MNVLDELKKGMYNIKYEIPYKENKTLIKLNILKQKYVRARENKC